MAWAKTRIENPPGSRSELGSAAIEFGLFIPILLILLTGTVEVGRAMYEAMQVNNAVEAGMLYAAKNGYDAGGIATAVQQATGTEGITATPAPTLFCGCPSASGVIRTDCNSPSLCVDGNPAGQYVQISAALDHQTILPYLGLPLPTTLTAQSIVRLH
jgi:Flp pilus assembly protein TadG